MKDKEKCFICNKDITNELPKTDVKGNHYCSDCYIDKCKTELKENQIDEMEKIIDNNHGFIVSREELAQKIYDDIFAILKIKLWLYGDDAMTKNLNGLTKQKILDFTKKWGIEDNHLNEKDYSHIDHLQAHEEQIKEQSSKETAERDFNHIIKALEIKKASIITHYGVKESVGADVAIRTVKELAKQYGVEIKE